MKFTAQKIKLTLSIDNPLLLEQCKVNKSDREYQIWKRKPLSVELSAKKVFLQKLEYIHYNPVKAGICIYPEDYYFSSALFYENAVDHFNYVNPLYGRIIRYSPKPDATGEKQTAASCDGWRVGSEIISKIDSGRKIGNSSIGGINNRVEDLLIFQSISSTGLNNVNLANSYSRKPSGG